MNLSRQKGFSLVELMVGMVVSSIVLAGAFTLWNTHQQEGFRLNQKINIRNDMTLSSKKIQRAVTLAGFGLEGAATLAKSDATGSDTLIIYTNPPGNRSPLLSDYVHGGANTIQVAQPSLFYSVEFVAVKSSTRGEIRRITSRSGNTLTLDSAFSYDYPAAASMAFPATRERFYSDQASNSLMRENGQGATVVAKDVANFQVSFRNKHGESTESSGEVRTVVFSFTGIYAAKEGALNSIVFSSTAIPRNTL